MVNKKQKKRNKSNRAVNLTSFPDTEDSTACEPNAAAAIASPEDGISKHVC
jgi:hypothetical protein